MGLTVNDLRTAAPRLAAAAEAAAAELNAVDGQLGDGDLGITVAKGWREVADGAADLPADLGLALLACAKAFQRVSSSSYGTLTATALMAAAKIVKGREEVPWSEVAALIAAGRDAMMARGKGALGDKSVLDAMDAVAKALSGLEDPAAMLASANRAADEALIAFRQMPSRLGRARIFAEKSIGLDDPGMLAFRRMLDGLTRE